MKFNNGKFTILIFADIHASSVELEWTKSHINSALDKESPDLVVLLGDNVTGYFPGVSVEKIKKSINDIGEIFEKRGIPFAFVFGNHDHEGLCRFGHDEKSAKQFIMDEFSKFPCCVAQKGEEMTGMGNYNIPVMSSDGEKVKLNLWFMDSNPYADESEGGGYGYVHKDQIEWYEKTGESLKKENGSVNVPSFIFQHIIVPEVYQMLHAHDKRVKGSVKGHGSFSKKRYTVNSEFIKSGALREGPCPPDAYGEQFASWLKRGDIVAAFFGHDHINDFSGTYKGIDIHQVPSTGFYSYGYTQGSRVITVNEDDIYGYRTSVIHCKDLDCVKIKNPYIRKHGYFEWLTRGVVRLGASAAVASAAVGAAVIFAGYKKRIK